MWWDLLAIAGAYAICAGVILGVYWWLFHCSPVMPEDYDKEDDQWRN